MTVAGSMDVGAGLMDVGAGLMDVGAGLNERELALMSVSWPWISKRVSPGSLINPFSLLAALQYS